MVSEPSVDPATRKGSDDSKSSKLWSWVARMSEDLGDGEPSGNEDYSWTIPHVFGIVVLTLNPVTICEADITIFYR